MLQRSVFAFCLWLMLASGVCTAQSYSVTDLGVPTGGGNCIGWAINTLGQVVGYCDMSSGQRHAFLWSNGSMEDLTTLPGDDFSMAYGINDAGQVVGVSGINNVSSHAFLWNNGSMQDLGSFPGGNFSAAYGINNAGHVVGDSYDPTVGDYPFLYANGSMQNLGTLPGGQGGQALGINSADQVVGYVIADASATPLIHGFLWSNGSMQDLGVLAGGLESQAWGINNAGHVVGVANLADGSFHAFLWSKGSMQDLGALQGQSNSQAFAINDSGQAVGQSGGAVLFANGTVQDLNALIPANSGWSLSPGGAAFGINASGQITGIGMGPSGFNAFLLTPITPYKAFVQPPINADGSSIFRSNRGAIPVKFSLTNNNTPTCSLPAATISVTRTAGETPGTVSENTYLSNADNGSDFRIDTTACHYIYILVARSLGVGTYRVDITINGLVIGSAVFALE